jgi:hypothetical protein
MPSAEHDLRYLEAGVDVLEDYLMSSDIFWPIGISAPSGERPYPQLTLGNLILSSARVHSRELNGTQRAKLAELDEQMGTIRTRWRVAWGRKAANEFRSRLNMWRNYLEEYRENPGGNYDRYAYEVRLRVVLHLLGVEAEDIPEAEISLLGGLDNLLQAVFVPGGFVWEPELASGFPPDPYWYLYGSLRKPAGS